MKDHNLAIKLEPKNPVSLVCRGKAHWLQRDFDRALADFDQAIKLDPNHAAAYIGRANTLSAVAPLANSEAIKKAFDQARRLNPRIDTTPWFPEVMPPP